MRPQTKLPLKLLPRNEENNKGTLYYFHLTGRRPVAVDRHARRAHAEVSWRTKQHNAQNSTFFGQVCTACRVKYSSRPSGSVTGPPAPVTAKKLENKLDRRTSRKLSSYVVGRGLEFWSQKKFKTQTTFFSEKIAPRLDKNMRSQLFVYMGQMS